MLKENFLFVSEKVTPFKITCIILTMQNELYSVGGKMFPRLRSVCSCAGMDLDLAVNGRFDFIL